MKTSEGHLEEEMEALPLAKIWLHLIPHAPLTDPSPEVSLQAHSHLLIAASRLLLSCLGLSGDLIPC